jgi:hypothetical protein
VRDGQTCRGRRSCPKPADISIHNASTTIVVAPDAGDRCAGDWTA